MSTAGYSFLNYYLALSTWLGTLLEAGMEVVRAEF
jgi:hypothetical protein